MKDMIKQAFACGALLFALASTHALAATLPISLSGTLDEGQDVQWFEARLDHKRIVSLATRSYAGGANASGDVILAGGFDPAISIYSKQGKKLAFNNDYLGAPADPANGNSYDAGLFQLYLKECIVLIAIDRMASPLDDRTGDWAIDFWGFRNVAAIDMDVEVPLPAAGLLFGSALLGLGALRKRQS
ncbi:MAG TPA: DVUA0089 family protein [Spongiibacteraceae bacterium]|jgi:hypothetical protein|nr:DVUA0089 family protein [Spongiibacteraceae bacterium]HUH38884.1 DVUA0089 family protein [Spongiibacteraceae bacterium]